MKTSTLSGKRLPESWEKQAIYRLSNGCKVTVEYGPHYGDYVKCLETPDGKAFYGCNGHLSADRKDFGQTATDGDWSKFPPELEFAREWIQPVAPGHWQTLMRPMFNRE